MPAYRFYQKERELFPEAFSKFVSDEEARRIVKKLSRHFKIPVDIFFYGKARGRAHIWSGRMSLGHNPSIGLIAHELGHFLRGKGTRWHDKRLLRKIKTIINYMKKKNYWEGKLIPPSKPSKPELTKLEIRKAKIARTEQKIREYENKISRYTKRLKKLNRSLIMLKKYL